MKTMNKISFHLISLQPILLNDLRHQIDFIIPENGNFPWEMKRHGGKLILLFSINTDCQLFG